MKKIHPHFLFYLKNPAFPLSFIAFVLYSIIMTYNGVLFYNFFTVFIAIVFGIIAFIQYNKISNLYVSYAVKFKDKTKQYYLFYSSEKIDNVLTINSIDGLLWDLGYSSFNENKLLCDLVLQIQEYHLPNDKICIDYLKCLKIAIANKNIDELTSNARGFRDYLFQLSMGSFDMKMQTGYDNMDKIASKYKLSDNEAANLDEDDEKY